VHSNFFIKFSLSFLLNPLFKTYLLPVLNDEQKNKLWEKWTSVYIADKSLVSELMGIEEQNSE
jgi:competence transcription factor ComK